MYRVSFKNCEGLRGRVNCSLLVHWAWPSSDILKGCLLSNAKFLPWQTLLWLHSGDTLHIAHIYMLADWMKGIGEIETYMVSFSCNWNNPSRVKVTLSYLWLCVLLCTLKHLSWSYCGLWTSSSTLCVLLDIWHIFLHKILGEANLPS